MTGRDAEMAEIVVQSGHQISVTNAAFAPDGRSLATTGADESVRLWDLGLGCEAGLLRGHRGPVSKLMFSGDGALLATGGWDHDVRVWDVAHRTCAQVLTGITRHPVDSLAIARDGSRVAATGIGVQDSARQLLVWDVATGRTLASIEVPGDVRGRSSALALTANGRRLTYADAHGSVHLLDVDTGTDSMLIGDLVRIGGLAFVGDPDTPALLVLTDRLLKVETGTGEVLDVQEIAGLLQPEPGEEQPLRADPDRPQLSLGSLADGTPVVHGPVSTHLLGSRGRTIPFGCRAISPDGGLLARLSGRDVELVDPVTEQVARRLGGRLLREGMVGNMHRQFVLAASAVEPLLAAAGPDGRIRLWDLATSPSPTVVQAHDGPVDDLAFSADGSLLASGGQGRLKVWPVRGGQPRLDVAVEGGPRRLCFTAEGSAVMVATWRDGVSAVEVGGGETIGLLEQAGHPESVTVSPWNDVAVGSLGKVKIWACWLSIDPSVIDVGGATCNDLHIEAEGRLALALGTMKWAAFAMATIPGLGVLLSPGSGNPVVLEGHQASVTCIRFSPDGSRVATGGEDGDLRIWDAATGACLQQIGAHAGTVTGLAWLADGLRIATIGYDGTVRVWDPDAGSLVATLVTMGEDDYVAVTPKGHYSATKAGLAAIVLRTAEGLHPFEEFDLRLNRPDLLLAALGYADEARIRDFADAHQRRLARLGVGPTLAMVGGRPPTLDIPVPPPAVSAGPLTLTLKALPGDAPLRQVHITVNDVPLDGRAGRPLTPDGAELAVEVELTPGDNELAVWCVDDAGQLSRRVGYRVFDPRPEPPRRLKVLTVGVSHYHDPSLALDYAAKDARDLATELRMTARRMDRVECLVLEDADRASIVAARSFLTATRAEDHVVVLLAGHGIVEAGDFRFLPADAQLGDLPGTTIGYADIEMLVDAIPARRRLVLLDTCHSGEDDLGDVPVRSLEPFPPDVRSRRVRPAVEFGTLRPAVELSDVFADLRQESGAFVIAAAGSAQYALERDDLQNGVFTASVIQTLRADPDITVTALADGVASRVLELTGGRQRPMIRRENLADDYKVL